MKMEKAICQKRRAASSRDDPRNERGGNVEVSSKRRPKNPKGALIHCKQCVRQKLPSLNPALGARKPLKTREAKSGRSPLAAIQNGTVR